MFKRYLKYVYTILIALAIIMFITYNSKDIDDAKSDLTKSNVQSLFKYLNNKEYYQSFVLKDDILTIEVSTSLDLELAKNLERDSAILFNVLDNLNLIIMNEKRSYTFTLDHLNSIFNFQLKDKKAFEIDNYYDNLPKDKIYLGNINGIYNVFDTSDVCHNDYQELYTLNNFKYEMRCSDINKVILVDNNANTFNLIDALNRNLIKPDDLITYNIDVIKTNI